MDLIVEVLKLNRKVDKSSTISTPTKNKRPLASEMRKKRRGSDGIGVRHVPIRTNSEILQERRIKVDIGILMFQPLKMRKKRRGSDGIGVRHVPIRSNSEILQERRVKVDISILMFQPLKENESRKGDRVDSNTTMPTEEIAGLTKKVENGTTKKIKRKSKKRNVVSDTSEPDRKHPRSDNDEDDNIFAELITADQGDDIEKKEGRVVRKKKVVGGKV
uniref:Uncharacterized protein n=1 Tax=Ascaris lumbricoides TaxID=6252 RepID=A0A0M3IVN7_ASCLU